MSLALAANTIAPKAASLPAAALSLSQSQPQSPWSVIDFSKTSGRLYHEVFGNFGPGGSCHGVTYGGGGGFDLAMLCGLNGGKLYASGLPYSFDVSPPIQPPAQPLVIPPGIVPRESGFNITPEGKTEYVYRVPALPPPGGLDGNEVNRRINQYAPRGIHVTPGEIHIDLRKTFLGG